MKKKKKTYPAVEVIHQRYKTGLTYPEVCPKGGMTAIYLHIGFGVSYVGLSKCWRFDTYNKKKGRSVAFGRLMKALDFLNKDATEEKYWLLSSPSQWLSREWDDTKEWIHSKIGKVDSELFWKAYRGERIV